ncbi:flagellar hook-associated protein FlgK [Shewanella surugensis]|uniref:Flagellar hook-associated protein 1 n=1 Tax=Shewanella surugensis TaxID=212020 RepID=A0ABT0LD07_9GAMM|nr:flagellar hook-associated protein FlgK [Shewanella surugensis]MCL1125454.1 flagellar hook-associated protein FlgK [Shewanella surugensis]
MAVDLLNIARTGVQAAQSQLAVTSNNITNANTEGYNRQVASQSSLDSQFVGGNFYGTGTYVTDVKRIYNDYAVKELRIGQTAVSAAETRYTKASELDQLFSSAGQAVPQGLNDLYSSLNSLADLPSDLGLRANVLSQAEQLASSMSQMQTSLDGQMQQTNDEITAITERINAISSEIANINNELMKSTGENAQLLDAQDRLIKELSEYAQVNVVALDTGAKSVMLGGSVMLVSGEIAMSLSTTQGDPFPNDIKMQASSGSTSNRSGNSINVDIASLGGTLGALADFRDETLTPATLELGQMALGISDAFNSAQAQGIDLNGELGQNMFTDINASQMAFGRVGALSSNTGTANLSVNIEDAAALTGAEYALVFTSPSGYSLTDVASGATSTLTLNGNTLEGANGFSIGIDSGALASGDTFMLRPTAGAASGFAVVMSSPAAIASSTPKITPDDRNSGDTTLTLTSIDDTSTPGFPVTGAELTFSIDPTANTFEVFDVDGVSLGAATTYTPPSISAYGFSFDIESTATSSERFIFDLSQSSGDNTNALQMAALSELSLMNGGKDTLTDVYEKTKLAIGSETKTAEVGVTAADAIYAQAYARVQSTSGVNLDEEAANLMRYQQAYSASAKIMTVATEIFDTLYNSLR